MISYQEDDDLGITGNVFAEDERTLEVLTVKKYCSILFSPSVLSSSSQRSGRKTLGSSP